GTRLRVLAQVFGRAWLEADDAMPVPELSEQTAAMLGQRAGKEEVDVALRLGTMAHGVEAAHPAMRQEPHRHLREKRLVGRHHALDEHPDRLAQAHRRVEGVETELPVAA